MALAAEVGQKPNILLILTDDADFSLLPKMPQIKEQLVRKGTTFPNAFAPFATCCPSRATILRGQYPHNTGVISNYGPNGGVGSLMRGLGVRQLEVYTPSGRYLIDSTKRPSVPRPWLEE